MTEEFKKQIETEARQAVTELLAQAKLKKGDVFVVGCSSSEIVGGHIGKDSSLEAAQAVYAGVAPVLAENGIWLAAQCCEHLNRGIIIEREAAEKYGWEEVCVVPRPHAGLGLPAYTPISSPLRRYTDLFNQGQVLQFIKNGEALFSQEQLSSMLPLISARSEAVNTVQKQRPRYWKLVYFKQQGDKKWHEAVISEENDLFVTVSLYNEQLHVRSKRALFGDKVMLGQHCQVRIGKVFPLNNEIQLLAVEEC